MRHRLQPSRGAVTDLVVAGAARYRVRTAVPGAIQWINVGAWIVRPWNAHLGHELAQQTLAALGFLGGGAMPQTSTVHGERPGAGLQVGAAFAQ